jgi:sRNA-binding carbon storage regulator CsrA
MLVLTRRQGQSILIRPAPDLDPATPISELFSNGPIEVAVLGVDGKQIKVGVDAPRLLSVLRNELMEK